MLISNVSLPCLKNGEQRRFPQKREWGRGRLERVLAPLFYALGMRSGLRSVPVVASLLKPFFEKPV